MKHSNVLRYFSSHLFLLSAFCLPLKSRSQDPFEGYLNKGLVGVGRISGNTLDKFGDGKQDTLGGFSAMQVEVDSLKYSDGSISGRIVGLPDRGFGDGATDYRPRLEIYDFTITPHYGDSPTSQNQIAFTNVSTLLFTYGEVADSKYFTGFDAGKGHRHDAHAAIR